jgi:hypothetical protein
LSPSDFAYKGYYDIQTYGNDTTYMRSLTSRYVNGQLRLLTLTHTGILQEFALPSAFGQKITATTNQWNLGSAGVTSDFTGIWYDSANQRLWVTSSIDYGDSGTYYPTRISTVTLNNDGTVGNVKTVSLQNIDSKRIYGGVVPVPAWFQQQYGCGPYAVGFGGYTSLMAQTSKASLGPELICIPDIANYSNGAVIPSSAFKVLLDYSSTGDRGVRATIPQNYFDGGDSRQNPSSRPSSPPVSTASWLSPNSQGLGWMVWGDSYYNTGMWIDGSTKQGFVAIASLCKGSCWYQTSTLAFDDRQYELHIWDGSSLNNGLETHPTSMTEIAPPRGTNPCIWGGNVPECNISGATYDPNTQTMYLVNYPGGSDAYTGRIYAYSVNAGGTASVPAAPAPAVAISAAPASITSGNSATLSWSSTNAASCTASGGWSGTKAASGSQSVSPTANTAYTLNCSGAGGSASQSTTIAVTAQVQADTQPPTVSVTSPANNAILSGVVTFTAAASDNVGVAGVQFQINGSNAGPEMTSAPYTLSASSLDSANGIYTITAVARDAAGNSRTSSAVTVTLSNPSAPAPVPVLPTTPADAVVSSWSAWSDASGWSGCSANTQTKTQQRTRTVLAPAMNGGSTPSLSETQTLSQSCSSAAAPLRIGENVKTTTTVNVRATGGGTLLGTQAAGNTGVVVDGPTYSNNVIWWKMDYATGVDGWSGDDYLVENAFATPVDAVLSAWGAWTDASDWSACSNGVQTKTQQRTRTVLTPATGGGATGSLADTQTISQACMIAVPAPTPVLPAEPAPSPAQPSPASAKFALGDAVQTSSAVRVRSSAGEGDNSIGTQNWGAIGKVVDGPVRSGAIVWWKVDYSYSPDGWSAEDYLAKYSPPVVTPPASAPSSPAAPSSGQTLTQDLYFGRSGSQVKVLQAYLIGQGYLSAGNDTGFFGFLTSNAVKAYQHANGIPATGYVGSLTRAKINADL